MVEKLRGTPESASSESLERLTKTGEQQVEQLKERLESEIEQEPSQEKVEETAREKALELAEEGRQEKEIVKPEKPDVTPPTKQDTDASYRATMQRIQSRMSAPSRAFSKVIHAPVIEKTSEVVGNTIARPNLVIAGALGAIASFIIYLLAKYYGYQLSGFETIGLFIGGWLIGAIVEYWRVGFGNKKV